MLPDHAWQRRVTRGYFLVALGWALFYLLVLNQADLDLWGVMSFGALLDQNPGFFPRADVFSYTALGHPWVYHEWGSGVVFFQVFKHAGSVGLFVLKVLLVGLTFWLTFYRALLREAIPRGTTTRQPVPPFWIQNICLLSSTYLMLPMMATTIRCQLFTFLGFAFYLVWLHRAAQQKVSWRGLWLLPALMLLWVNLHGGFVLGFLALGMAGLTALLAQRRAFALQLAQVSVLCGLAVFINPYGWAFWQTMVAAWSLPRTGITEWGNVFSLNIPGYGWLYTAWLLVGLGCAGYKSFLWPRKFLPMALLLLSTGLYGWLHYKLAPVFLMSLLFTSPDWLPTGYRLSLGGKRARHVARLRGGVCGLYGKLTPWLLGLLAAGSVVFYLGQQAQPLQVRVNGVPGWAVQQTPQRMSEDAAKSAYPVGVVDYLQTRRIVGNVWTPFNWGEFLYWNLFPHCRVSIDGRYETLYPEAVFRDFERFYRPPYQVEVLMRYPATTHVLIPTSQQALVQKMLRQHHLLGGGWQVIYQDDVAVLLARHASLQTPPLGSTGTAILPSRFLVRQWMDAYGEPWARFQLPLPGSTSH